MKRSLPISSRVNRSVRQPPESSKAAPKLFGKYDELVRMVLGFVFTVVVGAYLSNRYTTQQADLAAAGKVFNDHSKLVGDRYFAMNRVSLQLRELQRQVPRQPAPELQQAWTQYKTTLQEWNSARGFNREMIKLYFGAPLWNTERDLHYQFRAWGESLEAEYKTRGSIDFPCLEQRADDLLVLAHGLRAGMAQAMQEGSVGSSRSNAAVSESPRPQPWCTSRGSSQ